MGILIEDQDQRNKILYDLKTTLMVEAAAGTGKTTSLTGRMVNLLAEGECRIDTLAAVTFTRKAAAELRGRFQIELEKAHLNSGSEKARRTGDALANIEKCFIGTIHSFCARLLRERPVEAGVEIGFKEIDEEEDSELKSIAWRNYTSRLYRTGDCALTELEDLGIELGRLHGPFLRYADFPDVEDWPSRQLPLPDTEKVLTAIPAFVSHLQDIGPLLPENPKKDKLISKLKEAPRIWGHVRPDSTVDLMDFLSHCASLRPDAVSAAEWAGIDLDPKKQLEIWNHFAEKWAEPLCAAWQEHRYHPLLGAVKAAVADYESLKRKNAKLNYQDLLLKASLLLRGNPGVREYFWKKHSHILVDEFQDTDPIQAEVLLFLDR